MALGNQAFQQMSKHCLEQLEWEDSFSDTWDYSSKDFFLLILFLFSLCESAPQMKNWIVTNENRHGESKSID